MTDPTVRLALFKSNENKVSLRRSPKKGQSRKDSPLEGITESQTHTHLNKIKIENYLNTILNFGSFKI